MMRTESAGYRYRMKIAWKNVRANYKLRPADFINGFRMVHPLRALSGAGPSMDMAHLIMEMFTRLEINYQPQPVMEHASLSWGDRPDRRNTDPRVGLFVDAPDHLSGVGRTLAEWREQARQGGHALVMHTCGAQGSEPGLICFPPMGSVRLDAYAGLTLHIPRMADLLRYIDAMSFDVIHVSTPGPMGLLGLVAARQRGLPVCGTYHTDFPRYAGTLTGDPEMEHVGWQFMQWFYGQLDRVAAPTESIRRELIARGFDPQRLRVVGRGVRTSDFSPAYRSEAWRAATNPHQPFKLLYAGRLSREKNLDVLVRSFRRLCQTRPDVCLVLVGDGPHREEMQKALHGLPAVFTGMLAGSDLATAYASSDLFVFPSKTDTFGRVVLEAQASGLPVLVSDQGGPKDAMVDRETGWVVPNLDEQNLATAMDQLTDDPARLVRYRKAARAHASRLTPQASFEAFWDLHRSLETVNRISKVMI